MNRAKLTIEDIKLGIYREKEKLSQFGYLFVVFNQKEPKYNESH